LASIGTAEIVHAAHRGENITVIFVNNAIYGMTGGQMAPTTLANQVTTTSPFGRDVKLQGEPIRMSEMLATIPGSTYIERVTVIDPISVRKAKAAIKKAFQNQKDGKGFSMVEVLSTCNVGWGVTPREALQQIKNQMVPYFPLGVYKDKGATK
jgi:2-oxoglutarate ferredoxin oxidoreductase subunit beta